MISTQRETAEEVAYEGKKTLRELLTILTEIAVLVGAILTLIDRLLG